MLDIILNLAFPTYIYGVLLLLIGAAILCNPKTWEDFFTIVAVILLWPPCLAFIAFTTPSILRQFAHRLRHGETND